MSKLTTKDIKKTLAVQTGMDEKGWKRLVKYKNDQDEFVREFSHPDADDIYMVIEKNNGTVCVDIKSEDSQQQRKNTGPSYVSLLQKWFDEDIDEAALEQVKQQRGRDIFKEFCFAIYSDTQDGFVSAAVCIADKKGVLTGDQPIYLESLFPEEWEVEDINECCNYVWEDMLPPAELVKQMKSLGLEWSEDYQNNLQPTLTPIIKAALATAQDKPKPGNAPKP